MMKRIKRKFFFLHQATGQPRWLAAAGDLLDVALTHFSDGQGVMGLAFKENCPDIRNTRIIDIVEELTEYNVVVDVFDPLVDSAEAQREYELKPVVAPEAGAYDAIILAVAHQQFRDLGAVAIHGFGKPDHVLYDLKYILEPTEADMRL